MLHLLVAGDLEEMPQVRVQDGHVDLAVGHELGPRCRRRGSTHRRGQGRLSWGCRFLVHRRCVVGRVHGDGDHAFGLRKGATSPCRFTAHFHLTFTSPLAFTVHSIRNSQCTVHYSKPVAFAYVQYSSFAAHVQYTSPCAFQLPCGSFTNLTFCIYSSLTTREEVI